jgi:hypothetical protein
LRVSRPTAARLNPHRRTWSRTLARLHVGRRGLAPHSDRTQGQEATNSTSKPPPFSR